MPVTKSKRSGNLSAAKLQFIEPMYALAASESQGDAWLYEIKARWLPRACRQRLRQRHALVSQGKLVYSSIPVARACESLEPGTLLDGEIVAIDETGRSSFNLLQHHRSKAAAIQFYAFDLLIYRGRSLLGTPLLLRREMLSQAMTSLKDPLLYSQSFDANSFDLVRTAKELSLEGVIAKRKDSLYEPGKRSGAWLKYRINRGQELVIGGYTHGNPFDALIVGYHQDGKLNYAAKVRNGFVPRVRREVFQAVKGLQIEQCPFVNLPEKKRTQWALTLGRDEKLHMAQARARGSN